ncbi:M14 family metallopeptidase [Arsenicibacter rosenii]|uniref:Peptidase M14 n=1 Tax=Arsenicibacter rosenii TaxID=1750698 RepID=A0A1S2VH53_9BACT|nr:M14 family metallopeptidase [Arsenicibacter rosenii]OIN58091.1 peptidase M14 [Arsenicibacter rosenii]
MKHFITGLAPALLASTLAMAQPAPNSGGGYADYNQLTNRLRTLSSRANGTANLQSVGKSVGGKDIWLLTLGRGAAAQKPALAIVAGIDGSHLAGTELAVQLAEKLLASQSDSVKRLLDTKTLYIFPLVNPDAQSQAFASLKFERSGNDQETDDDRDGRVNEDPAEDLNRDGIISQIRIEDPTGQYIPGKDDPRVLVKADPAKGETGRYLLITEGIDNDKDGKFNEDGPGGVALDKNFTFDYPFFTPGAGEMPVSEPENRALLDFLYKAPNVYAVFTFGPYNNLSEAPKFDRSKTARRIITGILEKDATVGDQVSKLYNGQTSLKDAPAMPATRGNFAQTAYYHYGRLSFSTPGWWAPKTTVPADTARGRAQAGRVPAPATGDNDDVRYLKWADANKIGGAFTAWTAVEHPDFPGRKAEVGGIAPFAKYNPPVQFLNDNASRHLRFLTAFATQMPVIDIVNVKTEALGNGLTRVSAQVVNRGLLPTGSEMGDRVRYVPKMKVELKLANGQTVLSGRRMILRGAMAAGETTDVTFLVNGAGKVTLEAGNAMTGIKSTELTLN